MELAFKQQKERLPITLVAKQHLSTLLQNNVNPLHVQQLSGHKNLESLNSYHIPSMAQQRNMWRIICGVVPSETVRSNPIPTQHLTPTNNQRLQSHDNIDFQMEQELSKPWDPLKAIFGSSSNFENCTFMNTPTAPPSYKEITQYKRRRVLIESNSDSEWIISNKFICLKQWNKVHFN